MTRAERRALDPTIQAKAEQFKKLSGGGGYGFGVPGGVPAAGGRNSVNPFMIPKQSGINIISKTFPNNYSVEWNDESWRAACNLVIRQGMTYSYAALTSWTFEKSLVVRSLFRQIEVAISKYPIIMVDDKDNINEEWTKQICTKLWFNQLVKEAVNANAWGFSVVEIDPFHDKCYKQPMQQIDPINRKLRESTYNFYDGAIIDDFANLIYFQPDTSVEGFLGWMQPTTAMFIKLNLSSQNWLMGGLRLAFPFITIGYPKDDIGLNTDTGLEENVSRLEAEEIAANIRPGNAQIYPYTRNQDGTIQKHIEIGESGTSAKQNSHMMFSDFEEKNENKVRELFLLSTLTSNVGATGTYALGKVHEDSKESGMKYLIEKAVYSLNSELCLPYVVNGVVKRKSRMELLFNNFPKNLRFKINEVKKIPIDQVEIIAKVAKENGKTLTNQFFSDMGLKEDYFEEAKTEIEPEQPKVEVKENKLSAFFGSKKKL